jgi:hypothetical protein
MTVIEQSERRYCSAGKHPMDPAWPSCPYCSDTETNSQPLDKESVQDAVAQFERRKTECEEATPPADDQPRPAQRKGTQFNAALAEAGEVNLGSKGIPENTGRRMVGVVVTYSWRAEGQMFPVYEGRNYIGQDPDCEVRLNDDQALSGKHAAIFFRSKAFIITDEKSMNGTFVNGAEAPLTGMPLGNYSEVRTGATVWKFIVIEPQVTDTQQ